MPRLQKIELAEAEKQVQHEQVDARGLLMIASALSCALVGGVFFAFSTFVMRALADLPPNEGIRAMQRINITVLNPVFMGVFLGTAPLLALTAFLARQNPVQWSWLASAMALYLVGSVGVTIAFNVPRNNKLAKLSADSPEAIAYWPVFLREWLVWNHLRCICSLLAAAAVLLARNLPG